MRCLEHRILWRRFYDKKKMPLLTIIKQLRPCMITYCCNNKQRIGNGTYFPEEVKKTTSTVTRIREVDFDQITTLAVRLPKNVRTSTILSGTRILVKKSGPSVRVFGRIHRKSMRGTSPKT